jgi:ribosomal protein L7/L12
VVDVALREAKDKLEAENHRLLQEATRREAEWLKKTVMMEKEVETARRGYVNTMRRAMVVKF